MGNILIRFILVFLCGGTICLFAQLLIDKTNLTPARILVLFVSVGVLIYAVGIYGYLFEIFGEGIALPLLGFGAAIGRGVHDAVLSDGPIGILGGGLASCSVGIGAAIFCAVLAALFSRGKGKKL